MLRTPSEKWRFSTRILLPILCAGAVTVMLVAGMLLYATRESDRLSWERQALVVSHVLSSQVAKISHDQESVTIWDDAIRNAKLTFDAEWIDVNLGVWMFDYYGHDRAFLLDQDNQPIYAMTAGAAADLSAFESERATIVPLANQLRALLQTAAPGDAAASPATFRAADLGVIEGRPAIASILPIVSDSGEISQVPGSEYFHVAVRFLDDTFLGELEQQYLLEGTRFSWTDDTASIEAAFPLASRAGDPMGYFIWQPYRPGQLLLIRMAPALGLALALTAAGILILVRRLRRASTELQASEAQAQHLAFHDPLTGLPNRALFNDRFDRALAAARRDGSQLALLYLDVDRFKNINDTLGHPAGDDLIRELSRRLTGLVRTADDVSRLGGDEFAIVQADVKDTRDVEALCERIIAAVAQPFQLLGSSAFVGVSIGVAVAPEAGIEHAELVRKADIALYRAKLEGRNRFQIFCEEMDFTVQRRRDIERQLREALEAGGQLEVVYQPLYSARTLRVAGVEALLRWHHPTQGTISPGIFIPIAEETGLIHEIGDWVLRQACAAAVDWPVHYVAVNVSAVQFRSQHFAARVLEILRETGMAPHRLELEVTESVLLDSAELSALAMQELRGAGIRIALDDFGTGYSSLTYLQKYPVDKIKIDRSFVQNLDSDAASDAIVLAMVNLARALGVDVTAEGVETEAQRDALRQIGCDELQGYLLSAPISAAAIEHRFAAEDSAAPAAVASAA